MPLTASIGQQADTKIAVGNKALALVAGNQPSNVLANAPTAGPIIPISSQRITLSISPIVGAVLSDDAVVTLLGEINGSSFFPLYYPGTKNLIQWTGADIKQALSGAATGLMATIDGLKVNNIKFLLAIGSTAATSANGITTRVMD